MFFWHGKLQVPKISWQFIGNILSEFADKDTN